MSFIILIPTYYGKSIWEPISWAFWGGILWLIWNHRKNWRDFFFLSAAFGLLSAFGWRFFLKITTSRYYLSLLFPSLFIVFYFLRKGPWPKRISFIPFIILLLACVAKDFHYNKMERKSYQMYQMIKEDAQKSEKPLLILSGSSVATADFYSGLPSLEIKNDITNRDLYFEGLKHNLSFYNGISDCIYFCLEVNQEEDHIYQKWKDDPVFQELGWCWNNRHHKKKKVVFKYVPANNDDDFAILGDNILKNGDLSVLMGASDLQKIKDAWGRKLPNITADDFVFPMGWSIYHSETRESDAFIRTVSENDRNVLDIYTRKNFLSIITPLFSSNEPLLLCFSIQAVANSQIDLIVHMQNPRKDRGEFYPYFSLYLPADTKKEARIVLPAFPGRNNERIHFWLNSGHIRLSEIAVYPVKIKESYRYE